MRFKWLILEGWPATLPEELGEHTSEMAGNYPVGRLSRTGSTAGSCRQAQEGGWTWAALSCVQICSVPPTQLTCILWGCHHPQRHWCRGRVRAPTGTGAPCPVSRPPPSPCAPLLLLFLVATSLSGACLLELLRHPVIWDCTACPMLVLVLTGSLWTDPSCDLQPSRCLPATADGF